MDAWKSEFSVEYTNDLYPGMAVQVNYNNWGISHTLKSYTLDLKTQLPQLKRGQCLGQFSGWSEIENFLKSF